MAILQMRRFSICAMKKNRKAILEELQALGIMEVDMSAVNDETLRRDNIRLCSSRIRFLKKPTNC